MRILLISYYFPPFNTVGAVRPGKFAKYLFQHGHDVEVLCAADPLFPEGLRLEIPKHLTHPVRGWSVNAPIHWLLGGRRRISESGFHAVGVDRPWVRALGRLYKTFFHWPDAEMGWVRPAYARGLELMRNRHFDVIYVSAPPFSALRVGAKLSARSGVPWVVDFRDLWTLNHASNHPKWRLAVERWWEERLLKSASALSTVSPPLSNKLAKYGLPVWVIRNGYDPDDLSCIEHANIKSDRNELLIVYTGSIYADYHDVETFCKGLALFSLESRSVRVKVVGRNVASLLESARRHGVLSLFDVAATVPRAEALALQRAADILLMFLWKGGEEGIYTTKFFEYVGAERPILAIGKEDNDVGQWVRSARLGKVTQTMHQVADQLTSWHQKKMAGELQIEASTPRDEFVRENQYASLVANLKSLIGATK
jgi:glycosyltransferase involved in cell wall biosynthesis